LLRVGRVLLMTLALLTIACAAAVAWANGANDVSKGVATLVGSRLATYRQALRWGTLWTVAGAVSGLILTSAMVKTFGTALVAGQFAHSPAFPIAVAAGTFLWVFVASKTGLPVSTTHALTGAIVGTAIAAGGVGGIRWALAAKSVALPLAFSPFASALIACGTHTIVSRRLAIASRYCICARERPLVIGDVVTDGVTAARGVMLPVVVVDRTQACAEGGTLERGVRLTDAAQWIASAALSFARGLNDTPKIVALAAVAGVSVGISAPALFVAGAIAMAAGGLVAGGRVTRTLAEGVTDIDALEGLAASGVAALLVLAASVVALPVSTTHVVSGAIVGAGLRRGADTVHWRTVWNMALAWIVTLPAAAVGAAIVWEIVAR
jgi:inorganic phosphate transporter, PiT family